jgi:RimJ/RimL family protein N-acetyltransferase
MDPENHGSIHELEKLGMSFLREGTDDFGLLARFTSPSFPGNGSAEFLRAVRFEALAASSKTAEWAIGITESV